MEYQALFSKKKKKQKKNNNIKTNQKKQQHKSVICCYCEWNFEVVIVSGETTLSNCVSLPSEKGIYSKWKEFAPLGSKFFPFRVDPFLAGLLCRDANRKSLKLFILKKIAENLLSVLSSLKA